MLRLLLLHFIISFLYLSCSSDDLQQELNEEKSIANWVWPDGFKRDINETKEFNIAKIEELLNFKAPSGKRMYRSLSELFTDPLFRKYGKTGSRNFWADSVYMGESRALFDYAASPLRPRQLTAIGTTALGVYTNPSHSKAYNTLELIEMNPRTAELDFYFLTFQNGRGHIEKNPEVCQSCHGYEGEMRHIWQIYNRWPGMLKSKNDKAVSRTLGKKSDIGFTMNLYEINMARIAKQIINANLGLKTESEVMAAVIDCDSERFDFDASLVKTRIRERKKVYYNDLKDLIDDLNATGPASEEYTIDDHGEVQGRVIINRKDPIRLALLDLILENSNLDLSTWSISRQAGSTSDLFQASGGLSLSRIAFYLAANSRYRNILLKKAPNLEKLTYNTYPQTPKKVCEALLND